MSGGGAGGGGGKGAAAAGPVPQSSKKLVQGLKEIVNRPEAEIYAALRECGMDPDEAVSRLLSQDTFQEVKSKRDKKKEVKEIPEPSDPPNPSPAVPMAMATATAPEEDGDLFDGMRFKLFEFEAAAEDQYRERIRRRSGKIEKKYEWMNLYFIASSEKVRNSDPVVVEARDKGAIVLNEMWLDDTLKYGELADTRKILYRPPVALGGVKGAQRYKISHIGFSCKESEYLKRLVEMLGAENANVTACSYLICNTLDDYKATEGRGPFRVNRKWLEESVTQWEFLSVETERYVSWPRRIYRTPAKDNNPTLTSQREALSTGGKSITQLGKSYRGSPEKGNLVKRQALSTGNTKPHPASERDPATACKRFIDFNARRLSDFTGSDLVVTVQIPCSRKKKEVGTELIKGGLLGCYTAMIDIHSRGECIKNLITASNFLVSVHSHQVTVDNMQFVPFDDKIARDNKKQFLKMVKELFNEKKQAVPADIGIWLSCMVDSVPDIVLKNHINMQHPLDILGGFTTMFYVVVNLREKPEDRSKYLQLVNSKIMDKYKRWVQDGFEWDLLHQCLNYIHPSQIELNELRNKDKDTEDIAPCAPKERSDNVFGLLETVRDCFMHKATRYQLMLMPILLTEHPRLLSDLQRKLFELGLLDNLK